MLKKMTYADARKKLRKIGTAHSTGETLAAMYADLLVFQHGYCKSFVKKIYFHLIQFNDDGMMEEARKMLRDYTLAVQIC